MESHEVLKAAFEKSSPKEVSSELGVSLLFKLTGDHRIIEYICEQCDGYFVRNPVSHCEKGFQVLPATNEIVSQFSTLLMRISGAALDNSITNDEAEDIRMSWDKLKGYGEGFVRCCEEGDFELMEEVTEPTEAKPEVRRTLY